MRCYFKSDKTNHHLMSAVSSPKPRQLNCQYINRWTCIYILRYYLWLYFIKNYVFRREKKKPEIYLLLAVTISYNNIILYSVPLATRSNYYILQFGWNKTLSFIRPTDLRIQLDIMLSTYTKGGPGSRQYPVQWQIRN